MQFLSTMRSDERERHHVLHLDHDVSWLTLLRLAHHGIMARSLRFIVTAAGFRANTLALETFSNRIVPGHLGQTVKNDPTNLLDVTRAVCLLTSSDCTGRPRGTTTSPTLPSPHVTSLYPPPEIKGKDIHKKESEGGTRDPKLPQEKDTKHLGKYGIHRRMGSPGFDEEVWRKKFLELLHVVQNVDGKKKPYEIHTRDPFRDAALIYAAAPPGAMGRIDEALIKPSASIDQGKKLNGTVLFSIHTRPSALDVFLEIMKLEKAKGDTQSDLKQHETPLGEKANKGMDELLPTEITNKSDPLLPTERNAANSTGAQGDNARRRKIGNSGFNEEIWRQKILELLSVVRNNNDGKNKLYDKEERDVFPDGALVYAAATPDFLDKIDAAIENPWISRDKKLKLLGTVLCSFRTRPSPKAFFDAYQKILQQGKAKAKRLETQTDLKQQENPSEATRDAKPSLGRDEATASSTSLHLQKNDSAPVSLVGGVDFDFPVNDQCIGNDNSLSPHVRQDFFHSLWQVLRLVGTTPRDASRQPMGTAGPLREAAEGLDMDRGEEGIRRRTNLLRALHGSLSLLSGSTDPLSPFRVDAFHTITEFACST